MIYIVIISIVTFCLSIIGVKYLTTNKNALKRQSDKNLLKDYNYLSTKKKLSRNEDVLLQNIISEISIRGIDFK